MKSIILAAALAVPASFAIAADSYKIDPTHSAVAISYNHAGFSTTRGIFSAISGTVSFDAENPAASSVSAQLNVDTLNTGDASRDGHFLKSGDFFKVADHPVASFESTGIEVTGDKTAKITGTLTLNGMSKEIVLDAVLNAQTDQYPFPPYEGKAALGFTATTTVIRSEFGLGLFAPFVADEVNLDINIEAMK